MFYVFCFFTPLYWRFRLSHALQTVDLEEIYRLVSKILHFMACCSVLGRFYVSCKNFVASTFDSCSVRRALCPGRVRSGHDPLSHVPGLCCAVWFHWIFLDKVVPRGIGSQKCAPCRLLVGYLLIAVDRRGSFTMKKRRVLPFDLHLGRARTDQGRQHTHHIVQLIVPCSNFSLHALFRYNFNRISIELQ